MELTNEQKRVLYNIVTDIRDKNEPLVTMGGFAGVGKSLLITYLTKFFPTFAVCAYTGKAANVLRRKGIGHATTIHSRIYKPYFDQGVMYFDLTDDPGCDGFIVDEASMVSQEIYNDLKCFDLPIIFVGDHGQLEPIGCDFNLMRKPSYVLEEIHRNAGDIARFAEHIRKGLSSRGFQVNDGSVDFVGRPTVDDYMSVDQVICAYNKTRVKINNEVREALGFKGLLNAGEKVMCLRNNRTQGLYNGMQGIVLSLYDGPRKRKHMDFECDGIVYRGIWYDTKQFGKENYDCKYGRDTANPFDYANCITAHKAQGDEFDSVLVIEQKCAKWDMRRWSYTAASRPRSLLRWKCG